MFKSGRILVECSQNGPLVDIISFFGINEMTAIFPYISKDFYYAYLKAIRRVDRGYSESEYTLILNLRKGVSEKLLQNILHCPKIDFKTVVTQRLKNVDFLSYCLYKKFGVEIVKTILKRGIKIQPKHLIISANLRLNESCIEINKYETNDENKIYPFLVCCITNNMELIRYFYENEKIIREKGITKRKTISHVSSYGHLNVIKYLLKKFKVTQIDPSSLVLAVEKNHFETFKFLLNNKKVDVTYDDHGAFRIACQLGLIEIVKLFLQDKRTNVSAREDYALRWSIKNKHIKIVQLLLTLNVNVNAVDYSPIKFALKSIEILRLLLKKKRLELNKHNRDEILKCAINQAENVDVIKILFNEKRFELEEMDLEEYGKYALSKKKFGFAKEIIKIANA